MELTYTGEAPFEFHDPRENRSWHVTSGSTFPTTEEHGNELLKTRPEEFTVVEFGEAK